MSAIVFASLIACNDDIGGLQASVSQGSTTGPGNLPATTGASGTPTTGDSATGGPTTTETTVNSTLGTMTSTTSGAVSAFETLSDSGNSGITASTTTNETRGSDTLSSDTLSGETLGGETLGDDTLGGDTNNCGGNDTTGGDTGGPTITPCEGKIWACGDGKDNDGDGKIDNADVECISPCDDDEGSFQTDLPGQAEDCTNDCYWDKDSGNGQDKCEYDLKCDPAGPGSQIGCGFVAECQPKIPQMCKDVCQPLIPNGCDCFGCCHILGKKETYYIDSSDKCSSTNLAACELCTFQDACANPCEGCEICFGQTEPPKDCNPGDGEQCEAGVKTCTMGCDDCDPGYFCQTGCCRPIAPG